MTDKLTEPLGEFKEREIEIINLMADGLTNQEIADQLFVTKETVRWYNKQIYSKLGTSRRTEAIALARDMGIIVAQDATSTIDNLVSKHKLPVTTGPFIGRDKELEELKDLLQHSNTRLLSIIATGGMGKSRLSLELGHLLQTDYEHGVAFIDLASIHNPNDVAKFTVASLSLKITGNQPPEDVLYNYCREKELLLIFDNFEHVLKEAKLLSDILEVASKVKIIATSREQLKLRTETVFYLQPVTTYGDTLFIEVASIMRPTIVISDDDLIDVQSIVKLVGGLPLGLILAATWIDILSIGEIAEEIQTSLDFLSAEMRDMPERQHSIHAVIDPTWQRLNEKEQRAFMWSSVFRGGFTRKAFQTVTGASVRTLQTLLNRSLISHGYGRRYDMHPLLRQYAYEKLEEYNLINDARQSHLQTFLDYATTQADRMYDGQHYLESLDALETEADNIHTALEWSLQGNHIKLGVALILANGTFWLARSRVLEAITYIEKALQESTHPMLYYWYAVYLDRLGHVNESIEAANNLIAYGKSNQNHEILAYGQFQLGSMKNTVEEASPLFESALSNAQETGNQHLIANCHHYLAMIDSEEFSIDDPRPHFQQALKIFESLGDLHGISRVTNNIAIRYYDSERIQEAKELMDYSLQLKREIGDRAGEARRLTTLSLWAIGEEEFEVAQEWLRASRSICEELGEKDRLSYALTIEGLLYLLMVDFEKARDTFERSLQIHIDINDYRGIVDLHSLMGHLHLLQNNLEDARLSLIEAVEIASVERSQPSILIIVYVNYLIHKNELSTSIPIIVAIANLEINTYSGSEIITEQYMLNPLIYRIRQTISDKAWSEAVENDGYNSVDELFQDILNNLHPSLIENN